jgi:hypothetical protein
METREAIDVETRLNELRSRIDGWREARPRYARMPAEFWEEAIHLAEELGATVVEKALTLNRAALLRRMEEYEQGDVREVGAFVELPRMPSREATAIELEDVAGLRLTLRLPPGETIDLAQIVQAFRGLR